jgi:hypothetical protein
MEFIVGAFFGCFILLIIALISLGVKESSGEYFFGAGFLIIVGLLFAGAINSKNNSEKSMELCINKKLNIVK